MAKYNIKSLNYIATGSNRSFINMDIELDYYIYNNIHLLSDEHEYYDIGTELGDGYWYPTNYILHGEKGAWVKHANFDVIADELNKTVDVLTETNCDSIHVIPEEAVYIRNHQNDVFDRPEPLSKEKYYEQIILNEQQDCYVEIDPFSKKYIRLYLSCCTNEMLKKIYEFNDLRLLINLTYVMDVVNHLNNKNNISCVFNADATKNMYDIKDVTIKKQGAHSLLNINIFNTDTRHDVYVPLILSEPIGFCQALMMSEYVNDAIILTKPMINSASDLKTSLVNERGSKNSDTSYYTQILHNSFKTYLYKDFNSISSFSQGFLPVKNYMNVNRSFIVDMPVDGLNTNNNANDIAKYDDGVAYYKRLHSTKSAYDSLYTMNVSASYNEDEELMYALLNNCRSYVEILCNAGRPYLKFFDDTTYSMLSSLSTSLLNLMPEIQNACTGSKFDDLTVPFLKIEYIFPADYAVDSLHKSNVFTINIRETGILLAEDEISDRRDDGLYLESDDELESKLFTLKTDILHAINLIVENITPANTLLFDVSFGD